MTDRKNLWTFAALIAASIIILGSAPAQYLGRQQDDLMYALTAQSLAEGKGLKLITRPGSPAMTTVSPGLPILLAPLAHFFPDHFGILQLACAVILSLSPWLFWIWLKKRGSTFPGDILLVAIFATSPIILSQSGTIMSESLFLVLTLALLISLESHNSRIRTWGGGLSLMALIQTRLAGASLFPAAMIGPLKRRNWKEAFGLFALALMPLLIWMYWSLKVSGQIQKIQEGQEFYGGAWLSLLSVAWKNAFYYFTSLGSSCLPQSLAGGYWGMALGGVLILAVLRGLWDWIKKDVTDPAAWILISTFTLHLFWPWHYDRYLIMPLPLIIAAAQRGLKRWAFPILSLFLAAQTIFYLPQWLSASGGIQKPELAESYAWLRSQTGPGDILASALYVRDGFYAARPSLPLVFKSSSKTLANFFKARRVRYVLWIGDLDLGLTRPGSSPVELGLQKTSVELRDSRFFKPVYENRRENSVVYRIK
jgi:hypothetical protein